VTIEQPTPITPFVPVPPDADWEMLRARMVARLTTAATPAWTDHNEADPGITLLELAAYGLADLHYRAAERDLDGWPLEARDWVSDAERHWYATLPVGSLSAIGTALDALDRAVDPPTANPTAAAVLEPLVRRCASVADATALLSSPPWSAAVAAPLRPAVIALMRSRLVRRIAQEEADVIADVVAAQRDPDDVAAGDRRAVAELAFSLPLWDEEIGALVRRERRRLSREALTRRLTEVRAATADTVTAVRTGLAGDGLDAGEVEIALAAAAQPVGLLPEDLEDASGWSKVWPPHPIQALTCEPVTADDYARRARAHPDVGRAWAVPGRLPGIAWNGLPTGTLPTVAVDEAAAAITIVVERVSGTEPADAFLRAVLTAAIGPEATAPFPDWRTDVDDLEPRRLVCDEVGAGLLTDAPLLVQATLVTGVGVDRDAVVADVRRRITAFFGAGRPESRAPSPPQGVDGPWPRIDQPQGGWVPGEPVRFTEVVEAIAGNALVLGVEGLAMKVAGDPDFVPQSAGRLDLPSNAVPALAAANCLRVRFALTTECDDA
jgi:hypothetical protein